MALPKSWQSWRSIAEQDPKRLAKLVAAGIKLRDQRKDLEARAEVLRKEEQALKQHLIDTYKKDELREVRTKAGTARLVQKVIPQAVDWVRIYAHVLETGEFDLLQKRLHEGACRERWDAKVDVPGVKRFGIEVLKFGDAD